MPNRFVIVLPTYNERDNLERVVEGNTAALSTVYTDEWAAYDRLPELGRGHAAVCHTPGRREWARDDDGDGFCEVHVNTMEGFWSLLRSWLRPHRGISQESESLLAQCASPFSVRAAAEAGRL